MTTLREWYITIYADRFFTQPPAWFNMYMYMELVYHVPLSLWAIGALIRGGFSWYHSVYICIANSSRQMTRKYLFICLSMLSKPPSRLLHALRTT